MSARIDPDKLAQIRARQDYQSRLDAFHAEEENRQRKAKQLFYQLFVIPVVVALVLAVSFATVPMFGWMFLGFGGLTEFVIFFAWVANSRPRKAPQPPAGLDLEITQPADSVSA